ncbi:hypothetical protein AAC03nite_19960 [Alicyclobacillus acidoterrestris]|nr:hypothetical protein AAC03nite_19960 [Alicyclobacillus acidoterrestris]
MLTASTAQAIKAAAIDAVMRYLGSWSKSLVQGEPGIIHDAGLALGLIWEGNPTYAAYFTTSQAATDVANAVASAKAHGTPAGTGIAFTADYEAQDKDLGSIVAYFGVIIANIIDYKPGAYGDKEVLDALYQVYGDKLWYWQTSAWSGGQQCSYAALYQHTYGQTISGVQVDISEVYSDPGFWVSGVKGDDSMTMLMQGSTGDAVKTLQTNLNKLLGLNLAVDGQYGPATAAAVKSFQLQHGLTVDGIDGPQTQAAIAAALGALDVSVDKAKLQAVINELETVLAHAKALL